MRQKLARIVVALALAAVFGMASKIVVGQSPAQESDADEKDVFKNLAFRNLGAAGGGGRVAAVVGIPGNPNVYYVGAAGGGVFKTENGGITWKPIFEHESTSSIGAIALAPSDPSIVWVGTGESKVRNDVIDGRGVYVSGDAGHSWRFAGLGNVGQISQIIVDPGNPDVVYVGATGHAWGPNPDRGVFKTTDGGKTWDLDHPIELALSGGIYVGWPVTLQLADRSLLTCYCVEAYWRQQPPENVVTEVVRWNLP